MNADAPIRWPILVLVASGGILATIWHGVPMPVASLALAALLLWIAWVDLGQLIIPNSATLTTAICGTYVTWAAFPDHLATHGVAALIAGGGFWALSEIWLRFRHRDALGLGDAKLVGAGALWVGAEVPWAILIGAGTALIYGLMGAARDRTALGRPLPFGPFLALGLWWAWLRHGAL